MMSYSDFCAERNCSQTLGFLSSSPISIAFSRASSIRSGDTFSDQGTDELEVNDDMDSKSSDTMLNHS